MSRCLELLEPRGASDSAHLGQLDVEQQQKRRDAAIGMAFSEISGLIESKSMGERQGSAVAARAASKEVEAEERQAKERPKKGEPTKRVVKNRTATSRVQAKLELVRADAAAKSELESKVEEWRKARSDGMVERRNFIRENRANAHAASAESIVTRRSELFLLRQEKGAEALRRKGAQL